LVKIVPRSSRNGRVARKPLNPNSHNRPNMPVSKVNRNYQMTIPRDVRRKAKIDRGDTVMVEYDEEAGLVVVRPPLRGKRKTWSLGRRLTVEEIESDIERGQSG
jgi:antitoxin PrlF